ncbi:hypothetical protein AcV5_003466 [Taiwanofungus camphoratus]|nr:hypothetical protein AcV5_003466 [Antrodia cinnamomea]
MFTPPPSPAPPRTLTHQGAHNLTDHRHADESSSGSSATSPTSSPSRSSTSESPLGPSPVRPSLAVGAQRPHARAVADKQRTARHTRWTVLLVPAALVLVTLSTRYLTHPAALDALAPSRPSDWVTWAATLSDWHPHNHKRSPEPQDSGSGAGASDSIIVFPSVQSSSSSSSSAPSTPSTPTTSSASSASSPPLSSTTAVPTIPATPPVLPTPFPQAFDTTLSNNFSTESCEVFFQNMTEQAAFRSCRAFSLLVQSSSAFIKAQTNLTLLNAIVWGTCNTDLSADQCAENMASFAGALQTACAAEMRADNVFVANALLGLQSYTLLRTVACLPNTTSNAYCYLDAVRAAPRFADVSFYALPLGAPLPSAGAGTGTPSCGACTQDVMAEYVRAGLNATGLRATYAGAARAADAACGRGYVQEEEQAVSGAARGRGVCVWAVLVAVLAVVRAGVGAGW